MKYPNWKQRGIEFNPQEEDEKQKTPVLLNIVIKNCWYKSMDGFCLWNKKKIRKFITFKYIKKMFE